MFIADTHSDTLYSIGVEKLTDTMITGDRLRQGGVSLQVFALWSGRKGNQGDVNGIMRDELSAVPYMERQGLRKVTDPRDAGENETCYMLSIEGSEVFEKDTAMVEVWRSKGVRMSALVWNNPNAIGFPAKGGSTEGLTAHGVAVVKEMQRLGMAVDTSHLNEAGFWDIFKKTNMPPLASHSCVKKLCGHARNLSDEQIREMILQGGYIGVNFYPFFLSDNGEADVARVVEHIDYICQMGGANTVGFGSDFDGIESTPAGLANPADIPALIACMKKRGYSDEAIEGIAGVNLLRYYDRIDPR